MGQPKNILLLIADDLGREQMGCYGCKAIKTPHLDALAASGTQFDMAFTSTASCSGSRTVIYTGLHTHETGSYGLNLERNGFQTFANIETAPEAFNDIGYKTGILGKIHVSPDDKYPWQVREESDSRNVAYIADRASAFFQASHDENKPFFLTVGFVDPHRHIPHRGGFGNADGNHDPRLQDHIYKPSDVEVPPYLSDIPEVRQELAEYYRAITRMDQGVGLILAALDAAAHRDSTLVLFLSDNGPPFINSKTTLFEPGIRLPFLLRAPGVVSIAPSGPPNQNLISYIDILPTFLDWAGHGGANAPPNKTQRRGRSVLPLLSSRADATTATAPAPGWDCVFGSHTFHEVTNYWPTRFMRSPRWKYHRNVCWKLDFPMAMDLYASRSFEGMRNARPPRVGPRSFASYFRRPAEELYDLEGDPLELRNLAVEGDAGAEAGAVLVEMRRRLEEWQLETKDLWLWRDGTAVVRYTADHYNYAREGLRIPDRFDFDVEEPGTEGVEAYDLKE
ncbi:n-sulfoglucosamine sulfohydrolase [Diplodia corticola]|uniref:N-sulfoglucosamine sulfohydrolase n=1 Tax=Diplodia corticola TaxID=236234 RepID=A0A1J9QMD6_9PEZI|nr:n-sulfoglucosamine sulfohydrolase [Diplodia corticola]OJD29648.1 n-sulfoglucosamine sulfohydrolase [Diplodia corticola]